MGQANTKIKNPRKAWREKRKSEEIARRLSQEPPPAFGTFNRASSLDGDWDLPDEWEMIRDKNGRAFYANSLTKKTQWERPVLDSVEEEDIVGSQLDKFGVWLEKVLATPEFQLSAR